MSSDPQAVEDLYTKIALDNKLVTRFQVRKAAEELDDLARDGKAKQPIGDVMVRLGFLSERQHQSVVNACRYREQRDYDKRFGRQCLRMELLQQADIEGALEVQKDGYQTNGRVEGVAEILIAQQKLSKKQVDEVKRGIEERDKAKARPGKATVMSNSGPTPVLQRAKAEPPTSTTRPPPRPPTADLDDVDLDDADLGEADIDDDDLKDVDLDDDDLKDVDLDDDGDDELKGVDLDADEGDDDDDLDGIDLDEDVDGDGDDAADDDDDDGRLDIDPAKLDDLVEKAADDDAEDEADLAEEVSEIGSDVELDEDDLRAIDRMDSGDDMEVEAGAWAAEAFDDRPMRQRPPSERLGRPADAAPTPASRPSAPASPPSPPSPPAVPTPPAAPTPPAPPARPRVEPELAATASSPFQSADEVDAPPPPPPAVIPGGDVFDSGVSASAASSAASASASVAPSTDSVAQADDDEDDVPVPTLDDEVPLTASEVGRLIDEQARPDAPEPAPAVADEPDGDSSEEAALRDRLRQSARRLEAAMASDPASSSRVTRAEAGSTASSTATTRTTSTATMTLDGAGLRLDDPRVRRAFDKAMEAAWKVFLEELGG